MPSLFRSIWKSKPSRRDWLRGGSTLGAMAALPALAPVAEASSATPDLTAVTRQSSSLYHAVGVRPVINARGTYTILTGSQSLPEVKAAMIEASASFVQMDELMEGVSKKLAELTQAPWAIVTAGCCAALTNFTAAVIAGTNPERMQRLPNLEGLKNEVIIPDYCRNVYDHAIRMLGVKVVEVKTPAELEAAFNERTALIYIYAGPGDEGPLGTKAVSEIARKHNVPVIVDAAAEHLSIPNLHLQRGATAVAYSGGKIIRGPQAAGLLLGDKTLLQAAWANSAPHHAFGRSLKVGKEEIMGMLAAVEAWKTRDHDGEWKSWQKQLEVVAAQVTKVPGVTASVQMPDSLSNRTPSLKIAWDAGQVGITGTELASLLLASEPRVALGGASGSRPDRLQSAVIVTPWMLMPGEEKIVAERLHGALTNHPQYQNPAIPQGELASVSGQWLATVTYACGTAEHRLVFEQSGDKLLGTHYGEYVSGDLSGRIVANQLHFRSSQRIEGQRLSYEFKGVAEGDRLSGSVNLGEYGNAQWSAVRHHYGSGRTATA